ncbi:MAG: HAMP domain-containing sensor histidine kinase [Eubacteriales bacterium]|nr:HAMP domain-containing sensor histidine kinase [Eubacteriales bacterium]
MKGEKWKKLMRQTEHPLWMILLTAAVITAVYGLFAYPCYARIKLGTLREAFEEVSSMKLAALDEEDQESFSAYQMEKMEFLITDEDFSPIYVTRPWEVETQIEKYIRQRLDEFSDKPSVRIRRRSGVCILRLWGTVTQNEETYYVYIRREISAAGEIISYSLAYFVGAGLLALGLWYVLLRKKSLQLRLVAEDDGSSGQKAAQSLDEAQKEFVANVSHELKTPLAVISGQVEMLQSMGDNIDREYYFASIREEIDKMSDLVGNLLDLTIMDHHMKEMEMCRVSLSDMMQYMVLKYDALFQKNRIKVTAELASGCEVRANRMYLEQAVNNYLMNAFQHTAQGKKIGIGLRKGTNCARIEVFNEGAQIAQEDLERIWQSFYMKSRGSKEKETKISNAGLGLYMVKKIVEQHGGTCGVENRENGVEFWMEIPLWQ